MPSAAPGGVIETDALVIGAGPVGLFQVFQLGLLELRCEVVDALPHAGGQCIELYPDKPIYDIPGLPLVSGRHLVERLQQQIAPFRPRLHLGQLVAQVQRQDDGRWAVATDKGQQFLAHAVIIAGGAGAFLPRSIQLDGLSRHLGSQVLHHNPPPATLAGQQVLVLGDEDPALEAAISLAEQGHCAAVTLVHRRDQFRAAPATVARLRALCSEGRLRFIAAQPLALHEGTGAQADRLVALDLLAADGSSQRLPVDKVLLLLGLSPRLGPIADWGLALQRRQLVVSTEAYETAQPGIHAVGDINTYPGKKKLLLCGFHEATLAAFGVAQRVFGGKPPLLQYTTTSPRLHLLLGVAPP